MFGLSQSSIDIPYCPCPFTPPFYDLLLGKRGECSNEELLTVKLPPPHLRTDINKELCCVVEEENSFDWHTMAVLKGVGIVDHVPQELAIIWCYFLQKQYSRMTCRITGLQKPYEINGKGCSQTISSLLKHKYNSLLHTYMYVHLQHTYLHVRELQTVNLLSGPRGGDVMEE